MTDLERRVAVLERQMKSYRLMAAGLATALTVGFAMSPQRAISAEPGSTVKAPFRVVDAQGKTLLDVQEVDEGGALRVFNAQQKTVAVVGATSAGGVVDVFNRSGKLIAGLGASEEGSGHIGTYNKAGDALVSLYETKEGGGIDVNNSAGDTVMQLHAIEGGAAMDLKNDAEDAVASVVGEPRGGRISLYNPDQSRAVVAAAMGDTALVAALDRKKKGKSVIGADDDGGNLEVTDPDGDALLRKP